MPLKMIYENKLWFYWKFKMLIEFIITEYKRNQKTILEQMQKILLSNPPFSKGQILTYDHLWISCANSASKIHKWILNDIQIRMLLNPLFLAVNYLSGWSSSLCKMLKSAYGWSATGECRFVTWWLLVRGLLWLNCDRIE